MIKAKKLFKKGEPPAPIAAINSVAALASPGLGSTRKAAIVQTDKTSTGTDNSCSRRWFLPKKLGGFAVVSEAIDRPAPKITFQINKRIALLKLCN
jgi:hypothetical protein